MLASGRLISGAVAKRAAGLSMRNMRCLSSGLSSERLEAQFRGTQEMGSRKARYMRKARRIPGLLFGKDAEGNEINIPMSLGDLDVGRLLRIRGRSLECTLVTLVLEDGREIEATPRGVQLCPLTEKPLSLNFWAYHPGNRVEVPFSFFNEELSTDLKRGSFLQRVNKSMHITCAPGVALPPSIPVDLANKSKGQVIHLHDVVLPEGVAADKSSAPNLVIAKVSTNRG